MKSLKGGVYSEKVHFIWVINSELMKKGDTQ